MSVSIGWSFLWLVLMVIVWVGGWHTANRNCRQLTGAYAALMAQIGELNSRYNQLMDQYQELQQRHDILEVENTDLKRRVQNLMRALTMTRQEVDEINRRSISEAVAQERWRRLEQLKLSQARHGIDTPPEVTTEIEDLERELLRDE